jgi:hypothetical protein
MNSTFTILRWPNSVLVTLWLAVLPAPAQLPPSEAFSEADWPLFRAEVARLEKLLPSAPDRATITYELARTFAAGKQWPATIDWLRKVADLKVGLDSSRDSIFGPLRGTKEFEAISRAVRESTPAVSRSTPAFEVREGDLVPESIAYDPKGKQFYFGSMQKGKVVRCSASGDCGNFADGLDVVLGMKAFEGDLWLLNNGEKESALLQYDLASCRLVRRYPVHGTGHNLNDLAMGPASDVFLTDTTAGTVWHLAKGAAELTRLPGKFDHANGIAISRDGRFLYVSTYPDGIVLVDLKTKAAAPIPHPTDLCLATIDGLYFHRNTLIAIQNGFMTPRVMRFYLTRDLTAIDRFEVLERRNPLFDGVTTGVIVGDDFYYMANIQDDKKTGFSPIKILKVHLGP